MKLDATQFPGWNLDDEDERDGFLGAYPTARGRRLANLLGLRGRGSHKFANGLKDYAFNKRVAVSWRLKGEIALAMAYESNCDRIYSELPEVLRW